MKMSGRFVKRFGLRSDTITFSEFNERVHPEDVERVRRLRMLFSVPFFVATALWSSQRANERPLARRDIAAIVGLGLLSYYVASFLDFLGLQYISAGLGRLLQFVYPTVVVILSALFLRKRATAREVAALVLTYLGLLLVFWHAAGGEQRDLSRFGELAQIRRRFGFDDGDGFDASGEPALQESRAHSPRADQKNAHAKAQKCREELRNYAPSRFPLCAFAPLREKC